MIQPRSKLAESDFKKEKKRTTGRRRFMSLPISLFSVVAKSRLTDTPNGKIPAVIAVTSLQGCQVGGKPDFSYEVPG
jgi:hypothetical protein